MIARFVAGAVALVLLLGAAVFGTGSLPGLLFGSAKRLDIAGVAPVVAPTAAGDARGWDAYGGNEGGARWSALDEIRADNVRDLAVAWSVRTGHADVPEHALKRSAFEATPILFDDKLILCTPFNQVLALDPGTGEELWRFDAAISLDQRPANKFVCRGVSAWEDAGAAGPCAKTVFMGTNDARLIALDARTGERCLGFGEDGEVRIDPGMDLIWPGEFQITSPPAVAGDVVIVGSAISDNVRVAAPRGTVRAYDARTGALLWTFDPVPREASLAAAQGWPEGVAPVEGHANVWSTMSVDEERGLVFLPTSSPSPDFFGGLRVGNNEFANAVVALEAASGAVVWSFQTIRHDVWDYDVAVQPGLYTVTTDEGARDVVAVATKHGFVFVLDRETGAPVLPIKEVETPPTDIPGEVLAPTQPIPAITPAIVPAGVDPDTAFGLTGFDRGECRARLKALRDDGLFTPPSLEGTAL
ncbi:MAG: PQQ-binding-like beta-propeller repeat protein, partial [Pseudomonadota bacterium]